MALDRTTHRAWQAAHPNGPTNDTPFTTVTPTSTISPTTTATNTATNTTSDPPNATPSIASIAPAKRPEQQLRSLLLQKAARSLRIAQRPVRVRVRVGVCERDGGGRPVPAPPSAGR
eukprot:3660727-Pleurochrysis_carterae.AAC.1